MPTPLQLTFPQLCAGMPAMVFLIPVVSLQTEVFVHAFKDQLVRSALLALYTARPGGVLKKPPSPKSSTEESCPQDPPPPMRRQDSIPHHSDYDEEEWVSLLHIACLPTARPEK